MSADNQMPEGRVRDAYQGNWVDHLAPAATRPYLRLSRADRPIGTWLLLLPCWWGLALSVAADPAGGTVYDLWIALGCAIGAFLMRGAGCTWNDITDRRIDAGVARTQSRPLPSGQVTVRGALIWAVVQALISFGILLTFQAAAIWFGILALLPVAIYPFAKRFTWWPQVFLGIAFNWGALLAWAAHQGNLSLAPILLYLAGIAWTLFYDTIYAHQDKEDDALMGVKSTARLFGENSAQWLWGFLTLSAGLAAAAVMVVLSGAAVILGLCGVVGFAAHMIWQMRQLDINNVDRCLSLFRSNRDAGLIFGLFLAAAAWL
ncbi:4-hydroxybenzoate octaprenyltransferase [Roseobacter sp. HKCCD5988]|uniref:4-hydroxybenzoate octaprenyltransferase n=1 Tax=Roseobacter sp. HKCCD5988 TaxID=3120338 RepID=UPI0030EED1DB